MLPIRDNSHRNNIAAVFAICLFVSHLVRLAGNCWQLYLVNAYYEGLVDINQLTTSDWIVKILDISSTLIYIGLIITFIMWFRRAYYNLHIINPGAAFFPEGWAAGSWFIPFISLWRPYRIMKEIWAGTLQYLSGVTSIRFPGNLLGFWWAIWLAFNLAGSWFTIYWYSANEKPDIHYVLLKNAAFNIVGATTLVLLLIIIKKFNQVEKTLLENPHIEENSIFNVHSGLPKEYSDTND